MVYLSTEKIYISTKKFNKTIDKFIKIVYYIDRKEVRAVNETKSEVMQMTDKQTQMFLEAIKVIAEKSESKEEFLKELDRIQAQGIKKPQ